MSPPESSQRPRSKLVTIEQAAASIPSGAHLTFGGFAASLAPMAFVRELIRGGAGDFELSAIAEAWPADMLVGAGRVARLRMSNLMFEGLGRCRNVSRAIEQGVVPVEDYSHRALAARMEAAGAGLPFAVVRSMLGTDLERVETFDAPKSRRFTDPFSQQLVLLLPQLRPDVAVLHATRADEEGNVQLDGITAVLVEQARAAERVIVTVDEIVSTRLTHSTPERTVLPRHMVDMVAWAPYGAHPTGMFKGYGPDEPHLADYYERSRTPEGFAEYLDRFAFGVASQWEYLERVGMARLMALRADPQLGYPLQERAA
ncbi:CoA transferase subunit A [Conexibacter sp. CPCC 206217]|uniref:CoA transferase subunit A n=1 Tax=Conexibacter sp. CPCC 206217 TaxID=3064574 RepID=UPI002726B1FE|nr:CoA-transferase [Conexibacter sp. CPCC 206217]MDO8211029.1 CoA-transferase [Conexibacter sp. CPCC 206217]